MRGEEIGYLVWKVVRRGRGREKRRGTLEGEVEERVWIGKGKKVNHKIKASTYELTITIST